MPISKSQRKHNMVIIIHICGFTICSTNILCILGIVDTVVTKEGRKMWNHVRECAQVAFLPNWVLYKYINVCDFYVLISRTKNKCNLCTMKYIRIMFVLAYEISARAFEIRFMLHHKLFTTRYHRLFMNLTVDISTLKREVRQTITVTFSLRYASHF